MNDKMNDNITLKEITDKTAYNYVKRKLEQQGISENAEVTTKIYKQWANKTYKQDINLIINRTKKRIKKELDPIKVKSVVDEKAESDKYKAFVNDFSLQVVKEFLAKQIVYTHFIAEIRYIAYLEKIESVDALPFLDLLRITIAEILEIEVNEINSYILTANTLIAREFENYGENARKPKGNAYRSFGAEGVKEYAEKLKAFKGINADTSITINSNGKKALTLSEERKSRDICTLEIQSEFEGILNGGNESTCKLMCCIWSEVLKNYDIKQEVLTKDTITIKIKNLIEMGVLDTNTYRAKQQCENSLDSIVGRKIKVKHKQSDKTTASVLFTDYSINRCVITLLLNGKSPFWGALLKQYIYFPKWAFRLKITAFKLLRYTYYLARQGKKSIGFNSIITELNLPYDTTRKTEYLYEPIENAITEIEDIQKQMGLQAIQYNLPLLIGNVDKNYLDTNTITFELSAEEQARFNELAHQKQCKMQKAETEKVKAIAKLQAKKEVEKSQK